MQITSVEKNKKVKDRMSVFIDDRYSFSISESDYISLGLYDKTEITEEEIEYIRNTLNFRSAKSKAVKYLSTRLRTEGEVVKRLTDEGYDAETAARVIEELKSLGYINNRLYIQKYIYDRSKLRPSSKRLLRLELLQKGIDGDEIDEILDDWKTDEASVAEALARKKFGKYDLKDDKIARRLQAFLSHRGFSHEIITGTIEKLKNRTEY